MIQKILSAVVNYCLSLTAELHSRFADKKWRNKILLVTSNNCQNLAQMILRTYTQTKGLGKVFCT